MNSDDFVKGDICTNDDETEHQNLSRAQRKRLRKKKLKEEASRRGKLIGPLLPSSTSNDGGPSDIAGNESQSIRENADEEHDGPQSVRQNASEKPGLILRSIQLFPLRNLNMITWAMAINLEKSVNLMFRRERWV